MKNNFKKMAFVLIALLLVNICCLNAYAENVAISTPKRYTDSTILYDNNYRTYIHLDGRIAKGEWIGEYDANNNILWHYVNEEGQVVRGWIILNNSWYFFNEESIMVTGSQVVGGIALYFEEQKGDDEGKLRRFE